MSAINLERFRRQLTACLGRNATKPIPLTGIEKMALMEKSEQELAREFWAGLEDSFRREIAREGN
jgi:hypothetical protein